MNEASKNDEITDLKISITKLDVKMDQLIEQLALIKKQNENFYNSVLQLQKEIDILNTRFDDHLKDEERQRSKNLWIFTGIVSVVSLAINIIFEFIHR
ncbi:MAG: hypothetical protein QXU98_10200 [Candidatus Parvarchaeota archaeon]